MRDEPRVLSLPMTSAYYRLILRRFGSTAGRRAALGRGTGVGDDDSEITVRAQLRQLANLHALAPAGWGLEVGAALDGVAHGAAGIAIVTAPSLGGAIDILARYATARAPFIDFTRRRQAERFVLEVVEPCPLGPVRAAMLEMVASSVQWVVESALGRPMREAEITFPLPRPTYWRRYERAFHAPVAFAGAVAAISLPVAWLDLACPLADPLVHRDAKARLEALRQRLEGDFMDHRVERMLDLGDDPGLSLGDTARRLRISPRTLVRRLGLRRTSYRALLDGHRRRRAVEMLAQPTLTIAEIAERLGYEEPGNFARACRRWFGASPRAYRTQP